MALGEFFSQFRFLIFGTEDVLRNRRRQLRLALDLSVTVVLAPQKSVPARVCDFGSRGLRLRLEERLPRGRKIQILVMPDSGLDGSPSLNCRVAWCKEREGAFEAGCIYEDKPEILATSWVQMLLRERHSRGQDRRDRRIETTLPALLLDGQSSPQQVFVLDLSLGGARVYSAQPWDPGEAPRLSFAIPGQPISIDFAVEIVEGSPLEGSGFSYRLRFLDTDSKRISLLRKMLLQLLEGARRAGRSRKSELAPLPERPGGPTRPATHQGPTGKLGTAVRTPKKSGPRKGGVSPYLATPGLSPELPPRPEPVEAVAAPPPPPEVPLEALPTARLKHPGSRRRQKELLPEERTLRQRGWLAAALEGWFPRQEMAGNDVPRPTTEFARCLGPMLPGYLGMVNLLQWQIDTDLDRGFVVGPGMLWIDRASLILWWTRKRRLLEWVENSLRTRDRLERRTSSLRQKAFQLLSLLAVGGPSAVRQMLVSAQAAAGIAQKRSIRDPMMLNQIRLSCLLKDLGEALLFVGCQGRALRDIYLLHLNSIEHGEPELSELTGDWSGFRCPLDLQAHQLRVEPITVEMLPCHPWLGEQLLARLGFPLEIRSAIRSHHENWDGSGYPEGLVQAEIPWASRCLALADGFASAMARLNHPQRAFNEVAALSGKAYDPTLIQSLESYLAELGVLSS